MITFSLEVVNLFFLPLFVRCFFVLAPIRPILFLTPKLCRLITFMPNQPYRTHQGYAGGGQTKRTELCTKLDLLWENRAGSFHWSHQNSIATKATKCCVHLRTRALTLFELLLLLWQCASMPRQSPGRAGDSRADRIGSAMNAHCSLTQEFRMPFEGSVDRSDEMNFRC